MSKMTLHEEIYRGAEALKKVERIRILVAGCGALGSNLLDTLARQGFRNLGCVTSIVLKSTT